MQVPEGIHVQWVDNEAVVLNEATSELHYLNPQSALIYALLLEYGMPEALTHAAERIQAPATEVHAEVQKLIDALVEKGLLAEVGSSADEA